MKILFLTLAYPEGEDASNLYVDLMREFNQQGHDVYVATSLERRQKRNTFLSWLSVMTLKETSKVKPLDIMLALEAENIESRPVWKPMHLQPIFNQYSFFTPNEGISVSEDYFNRGVCLPSDTKMTEEQQKVVIEMIKSLF